MDSRPDWDMMAGAKSVDDEKRDGFSAIFTSIFQAFLPNAAYIARFRTSAPPFMPIRVSTLFAATAQERRDESPNS